VLRQLISKGWFVDQAGAHGDTPICVAAECASDDACKCINLLCIAGVRTE
jgi:hypothetical protein